MVKNNINENQIGKAGEFFVCADLSLKGFSVFINENKCSYDIVADTGKRLIRIQVKTSITMKSIYRNDGEKKGYFFSPRQYGKNGRKSYSNDEIDIFAFVALDNMQIAYCLPADVKTSMWLYTDEMRGKRNTV